MEAEEIGVVLARASELHAKINDAIERAMKSAFLHSTSGKSLDSEYPSSSSAAAATGQEEKEYDNFELYDEREVVGAASVTGVGNAEARSLSSIRDALAVLEEQLEALQAMQQQQRSEKDAALAELEESRRMLLRRLKDYQGREWKVVNEALAFAGEPVEERDDLPLPPYPRPIVDPSALEGQSPPFQSRPLSLRGSTVVKRLALANGDDEEGDHGSGGERRPVKAGFEADSIEDGTSPQNATEGEADGNGGGFLKGLSRNFGSVLGHATKAVLVVASLMAFLAISEHGHREVQQRARPVSPSASPAPLPASHPKLPPTLKCPPGKKLVMHEDGYPKCVVKERIELPFPREVKDPDVFYGRG